MTQLEYATFKELEGQAFSMRLRQGGELPLVLASVELRANRAPPGAPGRAQPFSLMFEGTPGVLCPQGNYVLRNDTLGEGLIFIVPVGELPDGRFRYQAVFT